MNYARECNILRLLVYLEDVQLPAGMQMRLSRLQAIHKYTYRSEEEFFRKLMDTPEIEKCKEVVDDSKYKNPESVLLMNKPMNQDSEKEHYFRITLNQVGFRPNVMWSHLATEKKNSADDVKFIYFGHYPQNSEGEVWEPIRWRVLDYHTIPKVTGENKVAKYQFLLISEKGLDCRPYSDNCEMTTWETSSIRRWLNNQFYVKAFFEEERSCIKLTENRNENNPRYNTPGGETTWDNLFLLSIEEAIQLFQTDEDRQTENTWYASMRTKYNDGPCCWWLWSPGFNGDDAADADGGGAVRYDGTNVDYGYLGVRPALWLNLESELF